MSGRVPVQTGLFEIDEDGAVALAGGRCDVCGRAHFPLGPSCPSCGGSVQALALAHGGSLWGWTTVATAPPGYEGPVPFGFGVVELPERLRVITRLGGDPATFEFGQPMRPALDVIGTTDDGDDIVTWTYVPAVAEEADR